MEADAVQAAAEASDSAEALAADLEIEEPNPGCLGLVGLPLYHRRDCLGHGQLQEAVTVRLHHGEAGH